YSGWEIWGTTVRWLPGAHAVILAYDSFDADAGWSLPQVSRFDFGAYTEAPTLTWNVQPSAHGTYLSGLDVRADGVYVAYGACDSPSRQEHLASRLDPEDGSTVWSYGQPHYADDWTYVEHHGIAVADDRVMLCVAFDFQAFPGEGWGLMMLDAATGERVDSGDMPRETYWSYGVAGLADEPKESVTVNPATPPDTASYDCAPPFESYPCPPLEFYAYGIGGFGEGFFLARYAADGTARWYFDADKYDDEPDTERNRLADALNAWPGYGGGSSTLDGYFAHAIWGIIGAEDRYGFYHVGPDGELLGLSMMLPIGEDAGGPRG